jgi:signal transduction histidine kinase
MRSGNRQAVLSKHPHDRRFKPLIGQRRLGWGLIFLFWTCMAAFMIAQAFLNRRPDMPMAYQDVMQIFLYCYCWALATPGIFRLTHYYGAERFSIPRLILFHLIVAVIIAMIADYINDYSRFFFGFFERRGLTNLDPWDFVFDFRVVSELTTYLVVLAAGFAREYFFQSQIQKEEAIQLRAQLAEARLSALRMQLNPHFLFNTLNAVSSLVERDPRGVRRMIARLSKLLRYTLDSTAQVEITLEQELAFIDSYLEIERIRFQGKLEVCKAIEPEVLDAQVPNLILQPLVENAIKHGVSQSEHAGCLELGAWRDGSKLMLQVSDNGPGLNGTSKPSGNGVGLRNTEARLLQMYGDDAAFTLIEKEQGLTAQISLPFHTKDDLHTSVVQESLIS